MLTRLDARRRYCTPPPSTSPRTRTPSSTPTLSTKSTPTSAAAPSRARTLSHLAQPPPPSSSSPTFPPVNSTTTTTTAATTKPLVASHTGSSDRSTASLTMVCGSVLSKRTPESARCAECRTFFGRGEGEDRTIYPIPGSDPLSYVCEVQNRRSTYSTLTASRAMRPGSTPSSATPVTPARSSETTARPAPGLCSASKVTHSSWPTAATTTSAAFAASVRLSSSGWQCRTRTPSLTYLTLSFPLVGCRKPAQLINVARQPSCNACFDASPSCTAQEIPSVPLRPSDALGGRSKPNATERLVLQFQQASGGGGRADAAGGGPSVSELRDRFTFVHRELGEKQASASSVSATRPGRPTTTTTAAAAGDAFKIPPVVVPVGTRGPASAPARPQGHRSTHSASSTTPRHSTSLAASSHARPALRSSPVPPAKDDSTTPAAAAAAGGFGNTRSSSSPAVGRRTVLASRNETIRPSLPTTTTTAAPWTLPSTSSLASQSSTTRPSSSPSYAEEAAASTDGRKPVVGWRNRLLDNDDDNANGGVGDSRVADWSGRSKDDDRRLESAAPASKTTTTTAGPPLRRSTVDGLAHSSSSTSAAAARKPAVFLSAPGAAATGPAPTSAKDKGGKTPAPWTTVNGSGGGDGAGASDGAPRKRSVLERAGVRHLGR